jgi:hypothetical protein
MFTIHIYVDKNIKDEEINKEDKNQVYNLIFLSKKHES